jgi:LysM repeat protein
VTRFSRLLLTASLSLGLLVAPATVHGAPDGSGGYVVEPGDYLFGIAHQQGVTLGDLLRANRLTLTSVIHPGQRLAIPAPAGRSSAGSRTYTVQSGDSLIGIARRHGVSTRSLLAANGLMLTSVIHPGQRLAIPAPAANASAGSRTYTVQSGDSLIAIARRHGVSTRSLLAANRLTLTSVIHPGQRLAIPAGANSPAPAGNPSTPSTTASAAVVERIIRDVWPDALEETALAIAWRESHYESGAQSQCCSGLFQIYYDVHKGWLAVLGINSRADLYNPRTNAEAAFALYQRAGGWGPWSLAGA